MPGDTNGGGRSPPAARLQIRLLGSVQVRLDGTRLGAFNSLRMQRWLALLILRPDLHHRSRIAFELWPDSDEHQARTNLRKLVHDLRNSLPDVSDFVEIDNRTVRWRGGRSVDVDVSSFRLAIEAGDLERAVESYSGDLLPACYDDWVLVERAKLRTEAYEVLSTLARDAMSRSDLRAAIDHARRVIELEPADEAMARLGMEAHLALGDRAAALRAYHRCVEALDHELGVAPSDETTAVYQQLRTAAVPASPTAGTESDPMTESPFVGRDEELGRLTVAWHSARAGRAHLVLVEGEPGIGKSRLAAELGRAARADGSLVSSARAYEAAGRVPWGPVVDLLRSDQLRNQTETLDPVWRSELARLLPELSDAPPSDPDRAGDLTQRYRLFDAVSRAMVAGDQPRLLIVDDLQWCDSETIETIGFVIRAAPTAPMLIVGTVRSEEIERDHPLGDLVEALERDRAVSTITLERFDEATTGALATRLGLAEPIDPDLAARLFTETDGNPLFVIEAVRAGFSPAGGRAVLTPTIRAVLRARLDQLPEEHRHVTEVAAVIGRPFSVDLLMATTEVDEHELIDLVDELWRRRIFRDQGHTYDFSHDKLRDVALDMVTPARRRRLHRVAADAIAVELAHDPDAASPQLAAHFDQAGMVEDAVASYRVAGARAVAVSALDEAVTMYRRAIALLVDAPASAARDALELELRIALGSPLVALDGYGSSGAHRLYERARSLCRRLDRPVDPPILRGLGLARLQGCRIDDCREVGEALLAHESHDPVARTEGRYLLGVSAFWKGDLATARHHLQGAIEAYDVSNRSEHLASYAQDPKAVCLVRLAWVDLWEGDAQRADRTARVALDLAADLDHLMTTWYVTTYAAIVAAESDDPTRLHELLGQADQLWRRLPMPYLMIVLEALAGWSAVLEGSVEAIDDIVRSVERSRTAGETLHLTYTLLLLARARGAVGDHDAGRRAVAEALDWTARHEQRYLEAELWRVDSELARARGDGEAATASSGRAVTVAESQGALWLARRAANSVASPSFRAGSGRSSGSGGSG